VGRGVLTQILRASHVLFPAVCQAPVTVQLLGKARGLALEIGDGSSCQWNPSVVRRSRRTYGFARSYIRRKSADRCGSTNVRCYSFCAISQR
jgi:hypothetical protein